MAFGSFFSSKLVEALTLQTMAILQQDLSLALANIDSSLPGIAEWNLAFWPIQNWPGLMLSVRGEKFVRPGDVQARAQEVTLEITIALSGQDRNLLGLQAYRYILAVDQIMSSLGAQVNASITPNFNDFYIPKPVVIPFPQMPLQSIININTAGMQQGSVLGCWPTSITYSDLMRPKNNLEMLVTETVLITLEEV